MPAATKNTLGQYFTPYNVAALMVDMLNAGPSASVLEPSAGEGVFLQALKNKGYDNLQGVEIDGSLTQQTDAPVDVESFVTWNLDRKVDAVIGNPPYIRWKNLDDQNKEDIQQHPLWGSLFNALTDFLTVFIAKSVTHLNPGGELVFITPRFWMHTHHSQNLRNWLLQEGSITDVVDFEEAKVFSKVSSSIIIFRFVKNQSATGVNLHRYVGPSKLPTTALALNDGTLFETVEVPGFVKGQHWTLATEAEQQVVDRMERRDDVTGNLTVLGDCVDIANGMVSGRDALFAYTPTDNPITQAEEDALIPVLKAKNFNGLSSTTTVNYIFVPDDVVEEEDFRRDYPNFYLQLHPHKEDLLTRHSYTPDLPYWAWAFKRSEKFHLNQQPKIFVPCKERLTNRDSVRFTTAPVSAVPTQDVVSFQLKPNVGESLEYLLVYLSLPEVAEWVRLKGLMKGGVAEFSEAPLSKIPVRRINFSNPEEVAVHNLVTEKFKAGETTTVLQGLVRDSLL